MLYHAMLCYTVPYHTIHYCTIPYGILLYYTWSSTSHSAFFAFLLASACTCKLVEELRALQEGGWPPSWPQNAGLNVNDANHTAAAGNAASFGSLRFAARLLAGGRPSTNPTCFLAGASHSLSSILVSHILTNFFLSCQIAEMGARSGFHAFMHTSLALKQPEISKATPRHQCQHPQMARYGGKRVSS